MAISASNPKVIISGDASSATKAFGAVRKASEVTTKALKVAAAAAAAFEAVTLAGAKKIIGVSAEFERYNVQLQTIEGSAKGAAKSMDWIKDFATKTPYELSQVTDAFVQLKAFGIDPVANDTLRILGDTSSAMGKTLDQAVQAFADASTGEFERLKEFGVQARVVGDQVSFVYQQNGVEMSKSADKNSREMIQSTLKGIWNDRYQGGMDKMSQTWDGMVSNLGDTWTNFQAEIGKAGVFDAAKGVLNGLMDVLSGTSEQSKVLASDISGVLVEGISFSIEALGSLAKGVMMIPVGFNGAKLGIDAFKLSLAEMGLVANSVGQTMASLVPGQAGEDVVKSMQANSDVLRAAISDALQEGAKDLSSFDAASQRMDSTFVKIDSGLSALRDKIKGVAAAAETDPIVPQMDLTRAHTDADEVNAILAAIPKEVVTVHRIVTANGGEGYTDAPQGSRATGGMIQRDGYYMMHAGERVVSNSQSFGDINVHVGNDLAGGNWREVVRNYIMPELAAAQR